MDLREGGHLILVEDNPLDAEMVMRTLRKHFPSSRVTWLKDGAEALAHLLPEVDVDSFESSKLVLLDLKLPLVDGHEVLERLKRDPRTRTLPVVVMSSSREESDIERCYRNGANSYVVKPVDFREFDSAVERVGGYWLGVNQTTGLE